MLLTALLLATSWYTMVVFVVFVGGNTVLGVMLSVLFAIGGLTWAAVATVKQTKRTVAFERNTVSVDELAEQLDERAAAKAPAVTAYSEGGGKPRSQRAQQALRKGMVTA